MLSFFYFLLLFEAKSRKSVLLLFFIIIFLLAKTFQFLTFLTVLRVEAVATESDSFLTNLIDLLFFLFSLSLWLSLPLPHLLLTLTV